MDKLEKFYEEVIATINGHIEQRWIDEDEANELIRDITKDKEKIEKE